MATKSRKGTGGVRVYKRKSGIYYLSWYEDGKRIQRTTTFTQKTLAEEDRKKKEAELYYGKYVRKSMGLEDLFKEFAKSVTTRHKVRTADRYIGIIKHLENFFNGKGLLVEKVTREEIEDYISYRKDAGLANATVNDELNLFHQIFEYAVDIGATLSNPVKKTPKLKESQKEPPRFLTSEEINIFLGELEKTAPHNRLIAVFILYTGLRLNEVSNLMWDDVDFKNKKVKVINGKGDKYREIPLHPQAKDAIEQFYTNFYFHGQKTGNVFRTKSGDALAGGKLYQSFRRAGKRAGLSGIIGVHTLRHTFASHLAMKNVPIRTLQEYMGHSDIETTMIYLHLAESHIKARFLIHKSLKGQNPLAL